MEREPAAQRHPDDDSDDEAQRCHRCGGLLLLTYYQDIHDDTGQFDFTALRCTVCGEVIDPVILKNRQAPAPNLLYGTKQRRYGQRIMPIDSTQARPSNESDDENELGSEEA